MALKDSLISHWKLNESSGTRNDSHSTNHLTDNNTVGVGTGKLDNAADFDYASREYLSITDNAAVSVGDIDFSFTFWMKPESFSQLCIVVGKTNFGRHNGIPSFCEYGFDLTTGGVLSFWVANSAFGTATWGSSLSTATWYFVRGWHDSVSNVVGIVVNEGTPVTTSYSGGVANRSDPFVIGTLYGFSSNSFDGLVDSVSFWKKVVTSVEAGEIYNSGNGLDYDSWDVATGHPASKRFGGVEHASRIRGNSAVRMW